MTIALDSSLAPFVWIGLSLLLTALAGQLGWAWIEVAPSSGWQARLSRIAGAGLSLGTGLWAGHAVAAALDPSMAGIDAGTELALWLCSSAVCGVALAWPDARAPRLPQRVGAAALLASAAVGVLAWDRFATGGSGALPGIDRFAIAWGAAAAGALGACLLAHAWHKRERNLRARVRIGTGALAAVGFVVARELVQRTAPAGAESTGHPVLAVLALLAGAGVLFGLRHGLLRVLAQDAARGAVRRERRSQAPNDPLTGLPTRQLFEGVLAQSVMRADAASERLAVLLVNLDRFKPINQSFGHPGGDQVLREVAARIRPLVQPHMAARMAGDEFLLLLTNNPQPSDASALAGRVIAALSAPFEIDERKVEVSCSIGVAMYPEHGAKQTMIAHAHAAMGAAKAAGGASHAFFEARLLQGVREDVELLRDLRAALQLKQLELFYQPKIHAPTGEITGAEALLRWQHPQRGMISPAIFVPIAERYGLINAIGHWVIDEACRQVRAWRDEGLRMRVAINLSVHQLRQADLANRIAAALELHQINPDLITCEVTETSAMDDTEVTTRVLGALDAVGVHLSIDDFGTGHSSLSYLRKLPADELKIDRSFVMDLETSEDARKVAVAVINLAKALNLKVVAEGVETEAQNRILREFGCDQLQGYLFAKPMSAKALALWAMDDVGPRTMQFRSSLFRETAPAEIPG